MQLIKDGIIKSHYQVRALYPDTSFSEDENFASFGWVEYVPPPPTQEELDAIAAAQAQALADQTALDTVKLDAVAQYLRDHTPAEIETYVQTNVVDLASARNLLKKFGIVLSVLAKRSLR